MKIFHCDYCDQLVFFESTQCVHCGHTLAYLPDSAQVGALEPLDDGAWRSLAESDSGVYRQCINYSLEQVCNWAVIASDSAATCESCRLTRTIPDLTVADNRQAWYRLEAAKRRLVYTLMSLKLPVVNRQDDPEGGLAFDFLADPGEGDHILTGHANGVITVNIAEANDAERERRRAEMREPYRTLLGHFRHESGHYYWDRLIKDSPHLEAFRELFGDERQDYAEALRRHYDGEGPAADWADRFISAYASVHPWEDWAETWAHYLNMSDTLETAAACGVSIRPSRSDEPLLKKVPHRAGTPDARFDKLIASWFSLTYVLNNLNRGLGLPDAYPFVLSGAAIEKLAFVHDTVAAVATPALPASPATVSSERTETTETV